MKVIVVGAGIAGLSAALALAQNGHDVTIYESAAALAEIGAGVQMTPNATKWFWRWGLAPDILAHSALPDAFNIRCDNNGNIIGSVNFVSFTEKYGAPYIVIHRADIHRVLHEHAVKAGVKIMLKRRAMSYDFEGGSVAFQNGETKSADLIIAMDGVNSPARQAFLPATGRGLEKTGWAAYRVMASVEQLRQDPRTASLVSKHTCNCWVGDQKLVMAYMVKGAEWLNMVLSHRDNIDTKDWTPEQYKHELDKQYGDWNPCISAMLEHASTKIENWPIEQTVRLSRWSSESGKFVLAGDAAHSMAFYLSMGVSMAVEDAAALCECLRLHTEEALPLPEAMSLFEHVRKERAESVRDASLLAGEVLQLSPGPRRNERDEAIQTDGRSAQIADAQSIFQRNTYGIADELIRDWCYGYDVVDAVRSKYMSGRADGKDLEYGS